MSANERLLENENNLQEGSLVVNVKRMPQICGPKLTNCCFVISIWGFIMLAILGIFYRINSVALLEDLPEFTLNVTDTSKMSIEEAYQEVSNNCFAAAGLYVLVFIFTCYQKWAMNRGYSRL